MVETGTVLTAEEELLAQLREGSESAFLALVDAYGPLMLRLALGHVRSQAVAEEVVQEAWLGVIKGVHTFEGRSALKTWIMRIVVNIAKSRGIREARCVPFSSLDDGGDAGPAVDPARFLPGDDPHWPGHWVVQPSSWAAVPEERLLAAETLDVVRQAIAGLPPRQQAVIVMRDVEGWDGHEVCAALDISEGNQRLLLHRARSRVRAELESHLEPAVA
jgi:RNA polymerase sigma-70 factor, ECF subfamily